MTGLPSWVKAVYDDLDATCECKVCLSCMCVALKDALTASLADHGLQGAQVQIVGNGVQIQMKNVSFPAWTQWLDDARRQFKVQVGEAHATALKDDGQVDLMAVMQPSTQK